MIMFVFNNFGQIMAKFLTLFIQTFYSCMISLQFYCKNKIGPTLTTKSSLRAPKAKDLFLVGIYFFSHL